MTNLSDILKESAKAITALISSYLVVFAAKHGVDLNEAQVNDVFGPIVIGIITWIIPNIYRATTKVHGGVSDSGNNTPNNRNRGSNL